MTDSEIYANYQAVVQLSGKAYYPSRNQVYADLAALHGDTWIAQHSWEIWQELSRIENSATGRDCREDWRKP